MTLDQWATLPQFAKQTRTISGGRITEDDYSFLTMSYLDVLGRRLGSPILLIRGKHGPDGSAVDWACPGVNYERVAMEALSLPLSIGIYSGLSVHADSRPTPPFSRPARWLAVHEHEEPQLGECRKLIYRRDSGWSYLVWSDRDGLSFKALQIVVELSEARRRRNMAPEREV